MPLQRVQGIAAIVERLGIVRPHGERAIVARQRQVILTQRRLNDGEKMKRIEEIVFNG